MADLEASAAGFSARNLKLTIDRSAFTGAVAFTQPHESARGRLFIDLHSDALDVDAAPNLADGADWLADTDLSLSLAASKLRIARVGEATLDSGSLVLKATKTGAAVSLDRLSLADLGGANIEAQGETLATGRMGEGAARRGALARLCGIGRPGGAKPLQPNVRRAGRSALPR